MLPSIATPLNGHVNTTRALDARVVVVGQNNEKKNVENPAPSLQSQKNKKATKVPISIQEIDEGSELEPIQMLARTETQQEEDIPNAGVMLTEKYTPDSFMGYDWKGTPSMPVIPTSVGMSTYRSVGQKKWRVLRNVFKSTMLLHKQEVKIFSDPGELNADFEESTRNHRTMTEGRSNALPQNLLAFQESFDHFRKIELFCEWATSGSKESLQKMEKLYNEHPSRILREASDPDNLLNKKCSRGTNALYLAAQNGNINVIKFLIENGANPHIESKVIGGSLEAPLTAACRWGHLPIVQYLVQKCNFKHSEIRSALNMAENPRIRDVLLQTKHSRKGFLERFCC
eukprot:TRINITY_DN4375_c0_g2_i10.p1 TRINITY_DN4375_c0_g2~~TRINITY_DN4375_c0_g2_i10.p1  ORF type:complete len:343 (+),score=28.92 TRINITY_DN4375_c0_g2_i10:134-1162(+)